MKLLTHWEWRFSLWEGNVNNRLRPEKFPRKRFRTGVQFPPPPPKTKPPFMGGFCFLEKWWREKSRWNCRQAISWGQDEHRESWPWGYNSPRLHHSFPRSVENYKVTCMIKHCFSCGCFVFLQPLPGYFLKLQYGQTFPSAILLRQRGTRETLWFSLVIQGFSNGELFVEHSRNTRNHINDICELIDYHG